MDDHQLLETIKSSFLFNFRTGNVMLDTFLTGLIIMFSTYVLTAFKDASSLLDYQSLKRWIRTKPVTAKITISGKKLQGTDNTRLEYSTNFFAVLFKIKQLNCVTAGISELSEVPIQEPGDVDYYLKDNDSDWGGGEAGDGGDKEKMSSKGMGTNLIVSQRDQFQMTPDVHGYVNITKENEGNEKNPIKAEEFQIVLESHTLNTDQLKEVLAGWVSEYEAKLNGNNDKQLKFFMYTPQGDVTNEYYDPSSNYSEFKFESGKSFDNVFYPEKSDIVKRIDFFTNNKDWYKKRGIPYTMGFLFYGDPGCGKTSTIKAIANHTQRHIVSIPLNKIRTAKELLHGFYSSSMNYKEIPLNKRLYVLEDIDAADLKETVGERSEKEGGKSKNKKKEKDDNDDSDCESSQGTSRKPEEDIDFNLLHLLKPTALDKLGKSNKLTLASLLEVLDGVMEMDGRMIVITTNYPEKLDKALIRPGRIDMKVKFNKMTARSILEMYEYYFDTAAPPQFEHGGETKGLPDYKWSPAEVTQVFLNNMHCPEKALTQLMDSESLENIHLVPSNSDDNNNKNKSKASVI